MWNCTLWYVYHRVNLVLESKLNFCSPSIGRATTFTCFNTCRAETSLHYQTVPFYRGCNFKLKIQGSGLTRCTKTGAQVSMTTRSIYKVLYKKLSESDGELVGQEMSLDESWRCTHEPYPRLNRHRIIIIIRSKRGFHVVSRNTCKQKPWSYS